MLNNVPEKRGAIWVFVSLLSEFPAFVTCDFKTTATNLQSSAAVPMIIYGLGFRKESGQIQIRIWGTAHLGTWTIRIS